MNRLFPRRRVRLPDIDDVARQGRPLGLGTLGPFERHSAEPDGHLRGGRSGRRLSAKVNGACPSPWPWIARAWPAPAG